MVVLIIFVIVDGSPPKNLSIVLKMFDSMSFACACCAPYLTVITMCIGITRDPYYENMCAF